MTGNSQGNRKKYDRIRLDLRDEKEDEQDTYVGLTIRVKRDANSVRKEKERTARREICLLNWKIIALIVLGTIITVASIVTAIFFFLNSKENEKGLVGNDSGSGHPDYDDDIVDDGIFLVSDVRFNKFVFLDDSYRYLLPLGSDSYPISSNNVVATFLKEASNGVSVVDDRDDSEIMYNVEELIQGVGGLPDHPPKNNTAEYWDKLITVIDMVAQSPNARASTALSNKLLLPRRWSQYTLLEVAEAVHDELTCYDAFVR